MKIFISWSGELSRQVALMLKDWLRENVHNSIKAFVSSEDIAKGQMWNSSLIKELEESQFGIVCVTRENINAPWIYFEAGALYANKQAANATPFLVDVSLLDLQKQPFSQFQTTRFDKADIKKLVKNINAKLEPDARHSDRMLDEYFEKIWWEKFEEGLNALLRSHSQAAQQQSEGNHYCPVSEEFFDQLRTVYKTHIIPPMDRSDLWYVVINTIDFKMCKARTREVLTALHRSKGTPDDLYDISIWSLLGEAELLVKFRAKEEMSGKIEKSLYEELSGGSGKTKKNLLEPTKISPHGMSVVNIYKEMVRNEGARTMNFKEGRFIQSKPIPRTLRSIKVFIRLRYNKGHNNQYQTSIQARLSGNIDSVESIAFTNEPPRRPGHIIIEAHFPCGRFGDLGKISSDLELELFPDLVKETYLAYDVEVVGADGMEVVSENAATA